MGNKTPIGLLDCCISDEIGISSGKHILGGNFSRMFLEMGGQDMPMGHGSPRSASRIDWNPNEVDITHFNMDSALVIGIGGYSVVRAVTKISDTGAKDNLYALKQLSKAEVLSRPTGKQSVFSELSILKTLSSTCSEHKSWICSLKFAFQDPKYLYIVLEHNISDLRYHMKRQVQGKFNEQMVQFYAYQLFLALQVCHDHDILHRDIKPENILVGKDGYLKLSDFGISKILSPTKTCRATSGTHGYMAPEIYFKGGIEPHTHGIPADYFAAGVLLHELLTGCRPFDASFLRSYLHTPVEDGQVCKHSMAQSLLSIQSPVHTTNKHGGKTQHIRKVSKYEATALAYLCKHPTLTQECKDFVLSLLRLEAEGRLGTSREFAGIDEHPWIRSYSLRQQIISRTMRPSYVPDFLGIVPYIPANELVSKLSVMHNSAEISNEEFYGFEYNNKIFAADDSSPHLSTKSTQSSKYGMLPLGRKKSLSQSNLNLGAMPLPYPHSPLDDILAVAARNATSNAVDVNEHNEIMTRLKIRIAKNTPHFDSHDSSKLDFTIKTPPHKVLGAWEMCDHLKSSASCRTQLSIDWQKSAGRSP